MLSVQQRRNSVVQFTDLRWFKCSNDHSVFPAQQGRIAYCLAVLCIVMPCVFLFSSSLYSLHFSACVYLPFSFFTFLSVCLHIGTCSSLSLYEHLSLHMFLSLLPLPHISLTHRFSLCYPCPVFLSVTHTPHFPVLPHFHISLCYPYPILLRVNLISYFSVLPLPYVILLSHHTP